MVGVDVDSYAVETTGKRLGIYGLSCELKELNVADIQDKYHTGYFDMIIFSASLEHMTLYERTTAIKAAYDLLQQGQFLIVLQTPNRLWHYDYHTSLTPFFNWLPDDLAMEYSRFTPRTNFNRGFDKCSEKDVLRFLRHGRSISYHDFDFALGSANLGEGKLMVTSGMSDFFDVPYDEFKKLLMKVGPQQIHNGFYDQTLNIALKKVT